MKSVWIVFHNNIYCIVENVLATAKCKMHSTCVQWQDVDVSFGTVQPKAADREFKKTKSMLKSQKYKFVISKDFGLSMYSNYTRSIWGRELGMGWLEVLVLLLLLLLLSDSLSPPWLLLPPGRFVIVAPPAVSVILFWGWRIFLRWNVQQFIPKVVRLWFCALHIIPPFTDERLLVEDGAVWAQEGVLLSSAAVIVDL